MTYMQSINSFKAYLTKELIEGIRLHRFLVLAVGMVFFAIADPILVKSMPQILKSQVEGMDISALIDSSQIAAMRSYTKNLYQISTLVIILSLMGIISGERGDKTLTIPASMGCSLKGILNGKILVYGSYLMLMSLMGMLIAYFYSGLIFDPGHISLFSVIRAGFLFGVFFIFILSLLTLISSLIEKPFIGGILTLVIVYSLPLMEDIMGFGRYIPTYLLTEANYFTTLPSHDLTVSLIMTFGFIFSFNILAVLRLENLELV